MQEHTISKRDIILNGNLNILLFKFSVPAMVAMVVNALYNVVGIIFVGKAVGSLAIAALSIVLPFQLIMMAIGLMIGIGSSSIISRALGMGNNNAAVSALGNGIIIGLILDAIFIIFGFVFLDKILTFFGASANVLPYARDYTRIILLGLVFITFSISCADIMRAEGNPRYGMYAMIIGAACNIALDPVFIFALRLGVKGAAIATLISQFISSVFIIIYFMSKKSIFHFNLAMFKVKFQVIKEILSIGIPSFIRQTAGGVIILIVNKVLVFYGSDLYIAIMGVGLRLLSLIQMPLLGITQGFSTIVGFNYGAKLFERVKKVLKITIIWTVIIAGVGFIVLMVLPSQIIHWFSNDREFISKGVFPLRAVIIFLPLVGIQMLGGGFFQAIGKALPALVITISRQILFLIPAVLVLPMFFGVDGVWLSVPLADFLSIVITGIWLFKEVNNFKQLATTNN
jgi:putative MATE family efflux protein